MRMAIIKLGQQVAKINTIKPKKTNGVFSLSKTENLWGNHLVHWDTSKRGQGRCISKQISFHFSDSPVFNAI